VALSTYGGQGLYAVTDNGDVYRKYDSAGDYYWEYINNLFDSAGVIPALSESWGSLKSQFKGGDK
jgi:hypothetical protein